MTLEATRWPRMRAELAHHGGSRPAGVLVRRLEEFTHLTEADRSELERLCSQATHTDWVIDIGPGAGDDGGRIVAAGPPAKVASSRASRTAPYLRRALGEEAVANAA